VAVELATAYVSIVPSTQGMKGKLTQQMNGPLEAAGEEGGSRFGGAMSGVAGKALKVGGAGVAALFAASLAKGFGRLQAIDDARFKLEGLGHDAASVDQIMADALGSVEGTAFGLGDAATIAASAVAAGIKPGEDLERILSITGDAASIAGTSIGDMGSIFNKVASGNRASMQEINQLSDRGIPIMQWLAEEYGVTALEAREMVEQGAVDFATFANVIEDNIGGAALTAGESFRGSFANMGAALGRFGAALLGPAFSAAPAIFASITGALNTVTGAVGPLAERFAGPLSIAFGVVAAALTAVLVPALITWGVTSTISAAKSVAAWTAAQLASVRSAATQVVSGARTVAIWLLLSADAIKSAATQVGAWVSTAAGAVRSAATQVATGARVVAGWVLMGAQSLLQAARMAAAWFIALGPVGWVIAAVVALVALIIANWETVVGWTRKAWTWVTDKITQAWERIKSTTSSAVAAVVGFFTNLRDRAIGAATELATAAIAKFVELKDGAINRVRELLDYVRALPGRLISAVGSIGTLLFSAGKDLIRGLIDGIKNMAGNAARAARDAVSGAVQGAKNFLGISSPSKVFMEIGEQSGQGLVVGLGHMFREASAAGEALAGASVPQVPRSSTGYRAWSGTQAGTGEGSYMRMHPGDLRQMSRMVVQIGRSA